MGISRTKWPEFYVFEYFLRRTFDHDGLAARPPVHEIPDNHIAELCGGPQRNTSVI